MEGKIRFRLRPFRMAAYLAVFAADLFLYGALQSYFLWLAAVIMIILPVASVVSAFSLCRRIWPVLGIGQERQRKNGDVLLKIGLRNPTWLAALHSQIRLSLSNTFLENTTELMLSMPVRMHGESELKLSVTVVDLGRFTLQSDTLLLQDVMGLIKLEKKVTLSGEVYVLPDADEEQLPDISGFMEGAAEMEEGKGKGSDFSEVSGVREYIPGDRQRDIHWKLSAGQDTLMVKERAAVSGNEMVIVLGLVQEAKQSMELLEYAFRLGISCVTQRMPVCLLCWNRPAFQFEEYRCLSKEELEQAYCALYQMKLTDAVNYEQDIFMRNCYPFLRSYLFLTIQEETGKVQVEMRENT